MGFKAVWLLQLSLLFLSTFNVFAGPPAFPYALPPRDHGVDLPDVAPAPAPHHHHHHHHHHHPHPPSPSPTQPPTHPPVHPPKKAPTPAPVYPPHKPPVHPPIKPPTKPPVHPPIKPPTKPPVHPPIKPPTKPPTHPPTKPPTHPPTKPPTHPPTKPPVHPPTYPPSHPPAKPPTFPKPIRSLVAVQGVVFCKSCKYAGANTLLGAKPILGATVKLTCMNAKYKQVVLAKTDKNGYFYIEAPKTITSYGVHKCSVSLLSSPLASCSKPSNLHFGVEGASLRPEKPFVVNKIPYILYTVGPFAFEPKCH